jgi:hypothetical protein
MRFSKRSLERDTSAQIALKKFDVRHCKKLLVGCVAGFLGRYYCGDARKT